MEWNQQWNDFVKVDSEYSSKDMELDDPRFDLYVNDGRAVLTFTAYLDWHIDYGGDSWVEDNIEDGYPTSEALATWTSRIEKEMLKYYSSPPTIDTRIGDGDPSLEVALIIPTSSDTVEKVWDRDIQPFVECMINMCDPGTFGSPYLFE